MRRDAADPNSSRDFGKDIIPYIVKHGKAVAHRFAKSCVRSERRERGLLARRRHHRRLLGGQYRPDRRDAGTRPLRPRLADLDLCRIEAAGKIRPRRGWPPRHGGLVAGLGRLHRLGRVAEAQPDLHRRAHQFLFDARRGGDAARLPCRPQGAAEARASSITACAFPEGLVVGEDPVLDAKRFRRTEKGICLITQDDDRQAGHEDARDASMQVLAVASGVFPLIKTGGLADVAGALPVALASARRGDAHARSRLSGGDEGVREDASPCINITALHGGKAAICCRRRSPGSICWCSTRRISSTAPADPMATPTGADWPDNWRRFAALSQVGADIAAGAIAGYVPRFVHAHDWQAALTLAYMRYGPAAGVPIGDHRPQPRLPGPVRRRHLRRTWPAGRRPWRSTASNITAASAF